MRPVCFALAAVTLLPACTALENRLDTTDAFVEGDTLYLSGTMNSRSYAEVERLLSEHPDLTRVRIGVIDGSIDDDVNLATGLLIHGAGLDTYLTADSFIESGGVDIFCAGRQRFAERGAHVGVHAWAYNDGSLSGEDAPADDPDHEPYLDYFSTVGCPVDFYWFTMQAAPADGMHIMSDEELIAQNVVTVFLD